MILSHNFVFTGDYNWQGCPTVKEMLVFSCNTDKELADQFLRGKGYDSYEDYSYMHDASRAGTILKLRAVKQGNGHWKAVIRSAASGMKLFESAKHFINHEYALERGRKIILQEI